jgi:uncharacterized glyoxalase superfamily protein PhnB
MLEHAVDYYKSLFGTEQRENMRMADDFWEDDEKVTATENNLLEAEFSEEEIKRAIDGSYAEGPLVLMDSLSSSIKNSGLLSKITSWPW